MTGTVLFIQGGGEGTHDGWDQKLADSLRRELGSAVELRYPRIAAEADPAPETWQPQLRQELEAAGEGACVVGHSIGGTLLLHTLADMAWRPRGLFLIAAPFVGEGGWPAEGLDAGRDLAGALSGVPVWFYHGAADEEVPPAHLDLYARMFPEARICRLPGRDHQLNDDLSEVARDVGECLGLPVPT